MDEQSGESEEKVMAEGIGSRKCRNWYWNEFDEQIKGIDSRDRHNQRRDQLFFREDDEGGRARVTVDEERVL